MDKKIQKSTNILRFWWDDFFFFFFLGFSETSKIYKSPRYFGSNKTNKKNKQKGKLVCQDLITLKVEVPEVPEEHIPPHVPPGRWGLNFFYFDKCIMYIFNFLVKLYGKSKKYAYIWIKKICFKGIWFWHSFPGQWRYISTCDNSTEGCTYFSSVFIVLIKQWYVLFPNKPYTSINAYTGINGTQNVYRWKP